MMEIRNIEISDKDYATFESIFNNANIYEARSRLANLISDYDHILRKQWNHYDEIIPKDNNIIRPIKLTYNALIIARNYWSYVDWLITKQGCDSMGRLSIYMPCGEKSEYHFKYFEEHWLKPNNKVYEIR